MAADEDATIKARIESIRRIVQRDDGTAFYYEAANLALTVLHDTLGGSHPMVPVLNNALNSTDWGKPFAASRAVVALYDQGALKNPRLAIAGEIEGEILDIAQTQTEAAEKSRDPTIKQMQLAIAAFLAGASLEDALRRLCINRGITYDAQRTSISKLQAALYQPAKQVEVISNTENKQITAWGDTRNKADHGKFSEITHTEVLTMVLGVRAFVEKHLPA